MPVGAEVLGRSGVDFRIWAPKRTRARLVLQGAEVEMIREPGGYFSVSAPNASAGDLYRFRLDEDEYLYPDPASRFQPEGPHGPSQVVDPSLFRWTDSDWPGIDAKSQIVYEMHIGTFTPEGTWESARACLKHLADTGITTLEIMPIAEFSGRWGWGYDGVDLFAPSHLYGSPDDVRRFIDEAHALGMGAVLDVVYNHLGPDGNYLKSFADEYFTDKYKNDWGEAINFAAAGTREFYLANAGYWIDEFHLDGLRMDATQDIHDESEEHILTAVTKRVRAQCGPRGSWMVAENEPQHTALVRGASDGGSGMDALWNDDFHHSAMVRMSARGEAYYTDYKGSPQEFVSAAKYGYLYQGQRYKWQKNRRGTPSLDLDSWNFVTFIQNHDQIANSAQAVRPNSVTGPAMYRAMTALMLLMPGTPMLFQGQEYGATTRFFYFCDHGKELSGQVFAGRREFLAQFRSYDRPEMQSTLVDPGAESTFTESKLDPAERARNTSAVALHKDLIRLRRTDPVLKCPGRRACDGAVLSPDAFVLRWFGGQQGDRLLAVNFGPDLHIDPAPEPLLAPPSSGNWAVLWSSESPRYNGTGTYPPDSEDNWRLPGHSAILFRPAGPSDTGNAA